MAKQLIMLIGPPGSGKSTWIREKIKAGHFHIASSDDILEEVAEEKGITYAEAWADSAGWAGKQMNIRAKQAINRGDSIIWDQTNMTLKGRRGKLKLFDGKGYELTAVTFIVDDDELKRRLAKREAETGKHIPAFVVANMQKSYVAPTKDEGFDNIVRI